MAHRAFFMSIPFFFLPESALSGATSPTRTLEYRCVGTGRWGSYEVLIGPNNKINSRYLRVVLDRKIIVDAYRQEVAQLSEGDTPGSLITHYVARGKDGYIANIAAGMWGSFDLGAVLDVDRAGSDSDFDSVDVKCTVLRRG